jgi:lysozyme
MPPRCNTTTVHSIMADLRVDEGLSLFPYRCPAGALTIGYGRNLDSKGISQAEADILLRNDVIDAEMALEVVYPGAVTLSEARYAALVNMIFNLGPSGFRSFVRMRQALDDRDFERAAREMLASRWAEQVGDRAQRLASMVREG